MKSPPRSSPESPPKSVITCDLDGRIETFNPGAEELFGYAPDEAIGRLRVSAFSPGEVVIAHVGNWLKAAAETGRYEGETVFVRKDGSRFPARIRITPTFRDGRQIGYCGVTLPLEGVDPEAVTPAIPLSTRLFKWALITRAPFLTATAVAVLTGAAAVLATTGTMAWGLLALVLLGTALLHLFANTANDYFDWRSGTDQANTSYVLPFTGGSRAIELGLISQRGLLRLSLGLFLAAVAVAAVIMILQPAVALHVAAIGILAGLIAHFYPAPPLRLAARKGLGELSLGLVFGPLLTLGTATVLRGEMIWTDSLFGLVPGLLTTAILWINQFPDIDGDRATGKLNLVAALGWERARGGYLALVIAAAASVVILTVIGLAPLWGLTALLASPIAVRAARTLYSTSVPAALRPACAATVQLQLVAGILFALGIALPTLF